MDAPTIELGKFPATLKKPRAIVGYSIANHPAIQRLMVVLTEHKPDEDAPDEPGEEQEMHPDMLEALTDPGVLTVRCAALATCWPPGLTWPGVKRPGPWKMRQPLEDYGADIYDDLIEADLTPRAIMAAGWATLWWVMACLPKSAEVKAARDFSEAPSGE